MNGANCLIRRLSAGLLAGLALLCSPPGARGQSVGGVEPDTGTPTVPGNLPAILRAVHFDQRLGEQVPLDTFFTDENGKTVALRSYFGEKPVVLILAYYRCPMLCSQVLSGAASAFRKLGFRIGNQFTALTVSFDPRETPALAAAAKNTYVQQYGDSAAAAVGWHFLTGQKDQIDRLTNAVGFHYAYIPQNGQYAHAAGLVVLTPAGKVSRYFYGVRYPSEDLRLALVQSSREKIGSVVDQIVLFCCTYDPDTGRYHAIVSRVLQIAGGATILLIGTALLLLYRWEVRRRGEHTRAV